MSNVKFGFCVESFPVDGSSTVEFVNNLHEFIGALEDRYDSWWFSDHFIPWTAIDRSVDLDSNPRFQDTSTDTLECLITLCHFAAEFKNIDFGSIVVGNSFRNPALLAKMAATLNVLTSGRFILGIGAGWNKDEFIPYGYEFPKASVRIKQLEESVQIIKAMWTQERATFKGEYYQIDGAYCNPKPDPLPPIMIGGEGEKLMLRAVAKYADWWNAHLSVDQYQHKLEVLQKHCDEVGRDYGEIKKTLGGMYTAIGQTQEEANEIVSRSSFIKGSKIPESFIGTPEMILEQLQAYLDLGVEYVILRFEDFPSTKGAKLFADEVISKLK